MSKEKQPNKIINMLNASLLAYREAEAWNEIKEYDGNLYGIRYHLTSSGIESKLREAKHTAGIIKEQLKETTDDTAD